MRVILRVRYGHLAADPFPTANYRQMHTRLRTARNGRYFCSTPILAHRSGSASRLNAFWRVAARGCARYIRARY
ncbi:hypothetical protein GCM10027052_19300 [Parafrigoribacterium mesophilum]